MLDKTQLDWSLVPEDLRHLAPLVEKYCESDDAERSALLADADTDDLLELSKVAEEYWNAINAFLDASLPPPQGPAQDLAIVLDYFLLAAVEARSRLSGPRSPRLPKTVLDSDPFLGDLTEATEL